MKFSEHFLAEVTGRFRLSEYVGRTVPLKRAGREFTALSPFVKEKTPSFFVNDDKAFFHDFASGKHGDIIDWLKETQGLDFVEAVKRLAEEAGVALPATDARTDEQDRLRARLEGVLHDAIRYYQDQLQSAAGREARDYLERRGLTPDDCSRFGIGYALNGNTAIRDHLCIDRGVGQDAVIAAGLLYTPEDGRPPGDRFRHRIMFPIFDPTGRPISFGGRALDPNARAKYLNGPDTVLFDKGRHLYGLDLARKVLAAGPGPLVVVEGYMDVIACLRAGIAATAPMGTSLTPAQMDMMWRFHPEPTLCFDADAAGRRAAARAMDQAIPKIAAGKSLRFSVSAGAKDPDQVLREQGADTLRAQMLRATPLAEAIFQRERDAAPLDTPERRADLRARLDKIATAIGDKALMWEYRTLFRERMAAKRTDARAPATAAALDSARVLHTAIPPSLAALAHWMVKDPERVVSVWDEVADVGLGHHDLDILVNEIVAWLLANDPDPELLAQHLLSQGLGGIVSGIQSPEIFLSRREDWVAAYDRRAAYLKLERAVAEAKADCATPQKMQNFMALKAQRDAAKRAL